MAARPVSVDRGTLQRLITQDQDALEMSVVELPMLQGISVSGVQPKLGLRRQGGRYVARVRAGASTRVIAKLPVAGRPHMPQLEMLSLQMAGVAGVEVCHAELAPLSAIAAEHSYALPDEPSSWPSRASIAMARAASTSKTSRRCSRSTRCTSTAAATSTWH